MLQGQHLSVYLEVITPSFIKVLRLELSPCSAAAPCQCLLAAHSLLRRHFQYAEEEWSLLQPWSFGNESLLRAGMKRHLAWQLRTLTIFAAAVETSKHLPETESRQLAAQGQETCLVQRSLGHQVRLRS